MARSGSMESIPRTLAENAGLDPIDTLIQLKSSHEGKNKNKNNGIDVYTGKVKDMARNRVIEPMRVKTQAVESATDVATMILRIDDIIASKRSEAPPMPPGGGGIYPTCGYVSMVHQNCTTPGDTTCLDERLSTLGTAFFGNDRLINTIDVGQPATCALLRAEIDRFYNLDQCTCLEEGDEPGQEYLLDKYLRNCCGKDIACGNVNQITPNCDI